MSVQEPPVSRLIEQVNEARAARTGLQICGGGTKFFYGGTPRGEPLILAGLSGISSYEPTELVVTVRGGTRLDQLEAALAEHGQCLPFEPPRFAPGGTVGGMVAAGLSGPARPHVGSVRDHVLGLTLLNGRGELLTFGGQVAKNVAGYDVSRVIAGSLGILGVICEVSLKVLPVATACATLQFEQDEAQALAQLRAWAPQPLPISATSWSGGRLRVRLSGARAAVAAAGAQLGGERLGRELAAAWWRAVRDHSADFFQPSAVQLAGESLWRVSLPAMAAPLSLRGQQFIEWRGAQRWWRTPDAAGLVRAAAARAGGHAVLMRGTDKGCGAFAPLSEALMRIHRGLKEAFDPARIFNPGRLYAEL